MNRGKPLRGPHTNGPKHVLTKPFCRVAAKGFFMAMKRLRFVTLANARAGHWVMAEALNQHPDIVYAPYEPLSYVWPLANEPCGKTMLQKRNELLCETYGGECKDWDIERCRSMDMSRFLDELWKRYNGFKISLDQMKASNPTWDYLHGLDDLKIIFIVRCNKLEQYVSNVLAGNAKIWHIKAEENHLKSRLDKIKIKIDTQEMIKDIGYWKKLELETIERFDDSCLFTITYEEIQEDFPTAMEKIQEFLGVKCNSLGAIFQKSNTLPIEERVINYNEMRAAYKKCLDKCVCTIVSNGHYGSSIATIKSMLKFAPDADGYIFVSDHSTPSAQIKDKIERLGIHVTLFSEVQKNDVWAQGVQYANHDYLRWASKPGCLNYLLDQGYKRVVYADNDCFFINKFNFLFDDLLNYGILLTPHWRSIYPLTDEAHEEEFSALLCSGIFNMGFVGVSQKGKEVLDYWRKACAWKCEVNPSKGLYVDQKYMDVVPAMFGDICKIIDHRGCNVASWNCKLNKRVVQKNGDVLINSKWPIIFLHFSWSFLDRWLKSYENRYKKEIAKWNKWIGPPQKFPNILLDCGANKLQGLKVLIETHGVDDSWEIHTFEPNPLLEEFILKADLKNLIHHKAAVGTSEKTVSFGWDREDDQSATTCEWFPKKNHRSVLQIDFAQFVKDNFNTNDHIVCKMNIEGSEYPVLQHLVKTGVINYFDKLYVEWHVDNKWDHDWPDWADEKVKTRCRAIREKIEKLPQYEEWG